MEEKVKILLKCAVGYFVLIIIAFFIIFQSSEPYPDNTDPGRD